MRSALRGGNAGSSKQTYYFAFYVLHHYADPDFRYSGLWDLLKYLVSKKAGVNSPPDAACNVRDDPPK